MSIVVGIWGDDKSGKTSIALSFPKPMYYMEFDIGGYDRAKYGYPGCIEVPAKSEKEGLITRKYFVTPLQVADTVNFRPTKIISGIKELWYEFLKTFMVEFITIPKIVTGVIDTGTLLWDTITGSYLQEKQELQLDLQGNVKPNERLRVSLLPVEYKEPNIRMRGLIYQVRVHNKNLVLLHHSRDEYGPMPNPKTGQVEEARTGRKERSGFASLGDSTNWMMRTVNNSGKFHAEMGIGTVPPQMVGIKIPNPTYNDIVKYIETIVGMRV